MNYSERKARRVIKQAMNASFYERFDSPHNGNYIIVSRAYRSKGYQSDYQRVLTYFLVYYNPEGLPIYGTTRTENAYKKERSKILEIIEN